MTHLRQDYLDRDDDDGGSSRVEEEEEEEEVIMHLPQIFIAEFFSVQILSIKKLLLISNKDR